MSRPEPVLEVAEPGGSAADSPASDVAFNAALLGYLARELERPGLTFLTPPRRLTGGFDTTIYAFRLGSAPAEFSEPLVARIFTRGHQRVAREPAIQNAVAGSGFPAPRILHVCLDEAAVGHPFTVMPLVSGKTILDAIASPSLFLFRAPVLMAETHARLHAIEPGLVYRALASANVSAGWEGTRGFVAMLRDELTAVPDSKLEPGLEWLEARLPAASAPAVCHLDYHPKNILVDEGRVSGVIDWVNGSLAEPAFDVGTTMMLMTLGPVDVPGPLAGAVAAGRRWAARRYLRAYQKLRPLPMAHVEYGEALRCYTGLQHASQGLVAGAPEPGESMPYAWSAPREVLALSRRFHELTGVTLESDRLEGLWRKR
ncbi:MAG TPA: phosphotransferase [Tepidiformaceae bacterium]|nr:phosphotransferase [Tepidiformaceae bacterium]